MSSNVKSHKGLGWLQVFERGVSVGWAYRFRLTLECGHELDHVSDTYPNRTNHVSPPAWKNCKKCEKGGD